MSRTLLCFAAAAGLLVAVTAGGCDLQTRRLTLRVDHYMEPCEDSSTRLCLRVLDGGTADETAVAETVEEIDGFEFEWGNTYELEVDVTMLGGEAIAYALVEEIGRTRVSSDQRFVLPLSPRSVQRVDDYRFELVYDIVANCETTDVCLEVAKALTADIPFEVELGHRSAPGKPFSAHAVWMYAD